MGEMPPQHWLCGHRSWEWTIRIMAVCCGIRQWITHLLSNGVHSWCVAVTTVYTNCSQIFCSWLSSINTINLLLFDWLFPWQHLKSWLKLALIICSWQWNYSLIMYTPFIGFFFDYSIVYPPPPPQATLMVLALQVHWIMRQLQWLMQ